MKREVLTHSLHVFEDGGAGTVTIDAMQLQLYPTSSVRIFWPDHESLLQNKKPFKARVGAKEKWLKGHRVLKWNADEPRCSVTQYLGNMRGPDRRPKLTQVVRANPLRLLAADYERAGAWRRMPREGGNVVLPFKVPPESIALEVKKVLSRLCEERVEGHRVVCEQLFGLRLEGDEVAVRFTHVELTWDRTCEAAPVAVEAFWKPWRRAMRQPLLAGRGPVLTGTTCKGERYKLYAKRDRVLRFEVRLTNKRIRKLLGHPLDPMDVDGFDADIRALAEMMYPRILRIQADVVPRSIVDLRPLLSVLFRKSADIAQDVFNAFVAGGSFENRGSVQRVRRFLNLLRRLELVEFLNIGKGLWKPRGELVDLLREVRHRTLAGPVASLDTPTVDRSVPHPL